MHMEMLDEDCGLPYQMTTKTMMRKIAENIFSKIEEHGMYVGQQKFLLDAGAEADTPFWKFAEGDLSIDAARRRTEEEADDDDDDVDDDDDEIGRAHV